MEVHFNFPCLELGFIFIFLDEPKLEADIAQTQSHIYGFDIAYT